MKARTRHLSTLSLVLSFCLCASPSLAQQTPKASSEPEVAWYTLISIEDSQRLAQAFEKKYPGVSVKVFRNRETALLPRIISEAQSGRPIADVISVRGIGYHQLRKRNLIQAYLSPESRFYPAGFKDPKGYWTDLYDSYYVWAYNTRAVAAPPRSHGDVVHQRLRDKIGMDNEETEWLTGLAQYWGRERAFKFLRELAAQQIRFRDGHSLIAELMAAGEFEGALTFSEAIERMKRKGAPVEWVKSLDPIVVSIHPVAIAAGAPNPAAARLLVDFLLSEEGQTIIRASGRIAPRFGSDGGVPLKLQPVDPAAAADYEGLQREWRAIFK
ncbi:MAG TPA: extracellular solute-binding protein [Candidatus Binatia bacterium]